MSLSRCKVSNQLSAVQKAAAMQVRMAQPHLSLSQDTKLAKLGATWSPVRFQQVALCLSHAEPSWERWLPIPTTSCTLPPALHCTTWGFLTFKNGIQEALTQNKKTLASASPQWL
ncbi:hypothetical protein KIL84_022250 [Mauremys mutica]|uniref:Uncharacterized protein n=1 Tax=Mauremys mutica TaxID=74926 RepID=A0A9D4B0L2_9SAUR|nr:hypothetical protein KIL84_022250 [Mauremys mutica]